MTDEGLELGLNGADAVAKLVVEVFTANTLDGDGSGGRLTIGIPDLLERIYASVRRALDDDWVSDE